MGHTCEVIWGRNWWLGTHIFLCYGYSYTSVKLQYSGGLKDQEHFHNRRLIHRVVGMLVGACTLYSTSTASSKKSPLATLSLRPQERFAPCTALSSVAGHQIERGRGECDGATNLSAHTPLPVPSSGGLAEFVAALCAGFLFPSKARQGRRQSVRGGAWLIF